MPQPSVAVIEVPLLNPDDKPSIEHAFDGAPILPLHPLDESEAGKAEPATVQFGISSEALWVYVKAEDNYLHNDAQAFNQLVYRHGDTIELFLDVHNTDEYLEIHFSPSGQRLQLRWTEAIRKRLIVEKSDHKECLVWQKDLVEDYSWVQGNLWNLLIKVPLSTIELDRKQATALRASVCRYNYDNEGAFTLYSTTYQTDPDFHRHSDWLRLTIPARNP